MNAYRVLVLGLNVYIEFEGQVQSCGFYTTVWVRADDSDSARPIAIKQVEKRPELMDSVTNAKFDPPSLQAADPGS